MKPEMLSTWSLRGYDLGNDKVWERVVGMIRDQGNFGLIVIDPLYKLFNGCVKKTAPPIRARS